MSLYSTVANYGGRQPSITALTKQFVESIGDTIEWIFVTLNGTTYIEPSIKTKTVRIPQSMIVDGNLTVYGIFDNPSDIALKTNIEPLDVTESMFRSLKPCQYNWKRDIATADDASASAASAASYEHLPLPLPPKHYGFIAQELEQVIPELVHFIDPDTTSQGHKAVNYIELIPILVSQIQTMQAKIDTLDAKLASMSSNNHTDE
jgi:hypothetical protein